MEKYDHQQDASSRVHFLSLPQDELAIGKSLVQEKSLFFIRIETEFCRQFFR